MFEGPASSIAAFDCDLSFSKAPCNVDSNRLRHRASALTLMLCSPERHTDEPLNRRARKARGRQAHVTTTTTGSQIAKVSRRPQQQLGSSRQPETTYVREGGRRRVEAVALMINLADRQREDPTVTLAGPSSAM
ncbi:hypothetical protein EJ03DRAFT_196858 [Teratosphaeria nubilosa]|uniref:Uncharacterized protein n=1 Tax=Teratosphaeria nubilosa TaxID=161662 RepID=A0A6G1KYY1_9PEZI|nr:hypothetical protein EJ03DRAFT_196858 [Teratosphaeria nubilosa]